MTTDTSEAGLGNLIIDAHAHIYSTDENAYPPTADPLRPPAGTGTIELLQREMRDAAVDRALLIHTYTFYGFDNRFIRDVSPNAKNWAGGVVNLDPAHPHSPDALHALVERSNIKAVRVSFEAYGYAEPGIALLYREARGLGIPVNALLTLEHAERLEALLDAYPDLSVVLDHCLNSQAGPLFAKTVEKVVELATRPNVYAKLSFPAMGSADDYPFPDMHEACSRFIEGVRSGSLHLGLLFSNRAVLSQGNLCGSGPFVPGRAGAQAVRARPDTRRHCGPRLFRRLKTTFQIRCSVASECGPTHRPGRDRPRA